MQLALLGNASATTGALNSTSVGDLSIGKDATAQAGGAIGWCTQGNPPPPARWRRCTLTISAARCGHRRQAAGGRSAVRRCDRQDGTVWTRSCRPRARCAWMPARR
ncbi:hypothetical protein WJ970_21140 [Achromobacter xylosoxidans]